jgi:hypothetical protein
VCLVGDNLLLGEWAPEAGVRLSPKAYPTWSTKVSLPAGRTFVYKYVKLDERGAVTWEDRGNRTLSTPASGETVERDAFGGN